MAASGTADRTELFETMAIPRAVMTLSVPTILSSLVMTLYNMADTYFVGMVNDPVQNAAVTLAFPILLSLNAVNNLFGVGSSSMISRALGAHDPDTARRSSSFAFYCSLVFGLLYSLLVGSCMNQFLGLLGASAETWEATGAYLRWTIVCGAAPAILNVVMAYMVRSEGASLHASIGTMSGCFLNIVLDPIFILPWGFNMGAAGAGLATFISNCVACLYFFIMLAHRRGDTVVCLSPRMFKINRRIVLGVFMVGIPASIQNLLNVTGMTILNNFTAVYGTQAVAAMGIAQKIYQVPMMMAMGMGQGVMPLIGYNYSSGNVKRMKGALLFAFRICICFLIAVAACYFLFSGQFISLFMKDSEVVAHGSVLLRSFCVGLPFIAVDFIGVGVYQACGLGIYSLVFALVRKLVLEIPFIFILDKIWPLYGLPLSQAITEMILSVVAAIVLMRLFRGLERKNCKSDS